MKRSDPARDRRSSALTVSLAALTLLLPSLAVGVQSQPGPSLGEGVARDFFDGFEDGDLDGWSEMFLDFHCVNREPGGKSEVVQDPPITGAYTLKHYTICNDHRDGGLLATDQRVVNLTEDFVVSHRYIFENESHKGTGLYLTNTDENGAMDGPRVSADKRFRFARARNPARSDNRFQLLDKETEIPGQVTPGAVHEVRVVKIGPIFDAYHDGEHVLRTDMTDAARHFGVGNLTDSFRLVLGGGGNGGTPDTIWYDDVHVDTLDECDDALADRVCDTVTDSLP